MRSESATFLMAMAASTATAEVKLALAAELVASGRPLCLRALGTSMLPTIWPGDLLLVNHCEPDQITTGDIIRFMQAGRFVIHRVIDIYHAEGKTSWVTRGDSVTREDAPVEANQLLGRVSAICRNGRTIHPTRYLSPLAHRFGCLLEHLDSLPGLVLRVRRLLRKRWNLRWQACNQ